MTNISPLSTPSATQAVLKRHGLFTKYSYGQNFLVNDGVLKKILELASVVNSDKILEVGPGIGTLSYALLSAADHLTAIEKDSDLLVVLQDTLAPFKNKFKLLNCDALSISADELVDPIPHKLVANLPYAVAATLVLSYLQRFDFLESATVMVQKEVADRMTAKPGTKLYGAYTVKLGLYAKPQGRFSVAAGNFFPPPRVESSVLRLDRHVLCDAQGKRLSAASLKAICTMADAAFINRRKTLINSCKTYFSQTHSSKQKLKKAQKLDQDEQVHLLKQELQAQLAKRYQQDYMAGQASSHESDQILQQVLSSSDLADIFHDAGIDMSRRGETLSQEEFVQLGLSYQSFMRA